MIGEISKVKEDWSLELSAGMGFKDSQQEQLSKILLGSSSMAGYMVDLTMESLEVTTKRVGG